MTVGENIRKIRQERGLTQKQLGELCGMNEANIRKYELGKANPKIETIDRIAFALEVDIVDILDELPFKSQTKELGYVGMQDKQLTNIHSDNSTMTKKEEKLLADFRKLNNEGQQYIIQTMDMVKDKYIKAKSASELEDIG